MSGRSSSFALQRSHQQIQRRQWLDSGKCMRCFHQSLQSREDGTANKQASPNITPRKVRVAATADRLAALERSKPTRLDKTSRAARGPGIKRITLSGPSRDSEGAQSSPASTDSSNDTARSPEEQASTFRKMKERLENPLQNLIRWGQGTATIAGSNYETVVYDQLQRAAGHGCGRQLGHGLVKANHARARFPFKSLTKRKPQSEHNKAALAPPTKTAWQTVYGKLVTGKHDGEDVLGGKEKYKQPTLNGVARAIALNSSYLANDSARFVNKVRSLIPAAVIPKKAPAAAR